MGPEDLQRDWCEKWGFGRITFAELEEKNGKHDGKNEYGVPKSERKHLGKPQKRDFFKSLSIVGMPSYDTQFGRSWIVMFRDLDDNSLVWKTSSPCHGFEVGIMVDVRATVKQHGTYKGEPQTVLERVRCIKVHGKDYEEYEG